MSKKCPYIKIYITSDYDYIGNSRKTQELFGDCTGADCPYYTQDTDAPSFCIRAQRPDDDAPGLTQIVGFGTVIDKNKK